MVFDPELKELANTSLCKLRLAINKKYKKDDEWKTEVRYIDVNVWGRQAPACAKYLRKGSKCAVDGELKENSWEKDGETKSKIEVTANFVEFLDKKSEGSSGEGQSSEPSKKPTDDNIPF